MPIYELSTLSCDQIAIIPLSYYMGMWYDGGVWEFWWAGVLECWSWWQSDEVMK